MLYISPAVSPWNLIVTAYEKLKPRDDRTQAIALGALAIVSTAFFLWKSRSSKKIPLHEKIARELLPSKTQIKKIEPLAGGFINNLWKVETTSGTYVLRAPKKPIAPSDYTKILNVSKAAAISELSPRIIASDSTSQHLLLEYTDNVPWPSYSESPTAYKTAMVSLRTFHRNLNTIPSVGNAPFSFIANRCNYLLEHPLTPIHFAFALQKIQELADKTRVWLRDNSTICHGDFHKGNVLLKNYKTRFKAILIDFDFQERGHPYFDVAKFSVAEKEEVQKELFEAYLGKPSTQEERKQFGFMQNAILMVVAVIRFHRFLNLLEDTSDKTSYLDKKEMEALLDFPQTHPCCLSLPYSERSLKLVQLSSLYALHTFLRRTKNA